MKKTKILLVGSLLLGTIIFSQGLSEAKKVSAAEGDTYKLVTDASTLSVGDVIAIANIKNNYALSATQKPNNRGAIKISIKNNVFSYVSGLQELTLEAGKVSDTWAFNTGSGYLYAANSKSNYLRTEDTLTDNSSWAISISSNVTSIIAKGTNTRNNLQFNLNNGSPIFSCYQSLKYEKINIFKKENNIAKHNVNYITNCDTKLESKKIAEGAEITLPTEELKKDGYILEGWYIDSEFKNKFVEGTKMGTQDVTLYANWILDTSTKYTVTFMLNDGTENVYTSTIVKENETIEAPTKPTRDGYKFTAWYTNIELTEEFNFITKITSDLTLYAGWEVYTIPTYTKITSNLDDWTGKYLIVFEDDNETRLFDSSLDTIDVTKNNIIINKEINSNKIEGSYEKYEFTFTKISSGYSIKSYSNFYIGGNSSKNSLETSLSNEMANAISINTNGNVDIVSNNKYLRYNSATGNNNERFRYYDAGKQNPIQLYKLEEKQEEKPTIDETTLTSYTSTLSIDNSKAIRFIGSVKETEFNNISKIGFNFTLTLENDNPISKEYSSDVNKLYKTINDSNVGIFDNGDAIYENNGFLNFSLILKNIPTNITAKIDFYSYAVINGKTYHSLTEDVVIMNGEIA